MGSSGLRALLFGAALAAASCLPAAHAQSARLTILDGDATVIDGARRFAASEGQAVTARMLIETGPRLVLLRLEWPDGTVADFGPDTRAMIIPGSLAKADRRSPAFYLLQGWAKQSSLGAAATAGHVTPVLQVAAFKGAVVAFVTTGESFVFVESGDATITERDVRPPAPIVLKAGEAFTRRDPAKGAAAPRPTPEQLCRVPRGFDDTLPLRAARRDGKEPPVPRPLPPPSYAELQA